MVVPISSWPGEPKIARARGGLGIAIYALQGATDSTRPGATRLHFLSVNPEKTPLVTGLLIAAAAMAMLKYQICVGLNIRGWALVILHPQIHDDKKYYGEKSQTHRLWLLVSCGLVAKSADFRASQGI